MPNNKIPVVLTNNHLDQVGMITINEDMEKLLVTGVLFMMRASVMMEEVNGKRRLVCVNLQMIPSITGGNNELVKRQILEHPRVQQDGETSPSKSET